MGIIIFGIRKTVKRGCYLIVEFVEGRDVLKFFIIEDSWKLFGFGNSFFVQGFQKLNCVGSIGPMVESDRAA